jgi:nucleotide-binding universal stress UspA family protein
LQEARERIGGGLPALETRASPDPPTLSVPRELARQPYDLVVLSAQLPDSVDLAEQILRVGEHHLLLVPRALPTFSRVLICVAAGEPGKDDVLFTGRLVRHLGASATLLSVLPREGGHPQVRARTERFLEAGVRTLGALGVPAQQTIRTGVVRDEILAEAAEGGYDLLVLGAPLACSEGRGALAGVVGQILSAAADRPVMIVRSSHTASRVPWLGTNGRVNFPEEVIR